MTIDRSISDPLASVRPGMGANLLGFNALQLLPTEQVDGIDGEGYGATKMFAPHNGYRTPADLCWRSVSERESLVDAAHGNGLAVIFDVVYHYASSSHNHYWQYDGNTTDGGGIYFEDPFHYEPVRDEDGRSFAHWKSEVQNFFLDHARMLLHEYRGDSLRFDMAHTPSKYVRDLQTQADGKLYINLPKWSMLIFRKQ
jgi:1,4-alpha-glucan branching enzyme